MKKAFKAIVVAILGSQVRRLRRKHDFKVVAVTGSIGKTSTKLAVAKVLSEQYKVNHQEGNYNHIVTVPLVFFGRHLPSLANPVAWLVTLIKNELQIYKHYAYDVVVLELGTDGPGQLAEFAKYLDVDLLIVTAITPEHMEFFADINEVAKEELSPTAYSKAVLVNKDLCSPAHLALINKEYLTYSMKEPATYELTINNFASGRYNFTIKHESRQLINGIYSGVADIELYSVCAAAAVADQFEVAAEKVVMAIEKLKAFSGRMQQLAGINQSLIIDDSYNASPAAMKSALDALYKLSAPQKIALLGNMNELGKHSPAAHTEIGEYCDPKELSLVVTIGPDANKYLAESATKRGCAVKTFDNPYDAGMFIKEAIKPQAAVLVKGSQNGVYAEEAIKYFLDNPADSSHLVRQSPAWLAKKKKGFKNV